MSRIFVSIVVVLTASFLAAGASAQEAATPIASGEPGALVNGVAVCPPNLEGADIDPADCSEPAANVGFYAANPNTDNVAFGDTVGDGLVSFPLDQFAINPEGATVEVGVIGDADPYGAITGYAVSCTNNGAPIDVSYVSGEVQPGGATLGVQFTAIPGDQVACEWYLSHAGDDGGNDDASNDQSGGGTVIQLPSTGTGGDTGGVDTALLGGLGLLAMVGGVISLVATRQVRTAGR
jgi:hypothetical protein